MKYLICIIFFFTVFIGNAQIITVKSKATKKSIVGVTVFNEDKTRSEISNTKGEIDFTNFKKDEALIIKHLSFAEQLIYKSQIIGNTIFLESNLQGLDEIVLSTSKFKESKTDVARTISTINAKQISFTNSQTSADVLQETGKVYIQKSQLGGGSPIIRGFSANRLLINVDGVRMNNAIFRSGNLQNVIAIDPFTIESTEVTLGPGTSIYGSDAIGGVMSFNTIKPKVSYNDSLILNASSTIRYASASNEQTIHSNINLGFKKWAFLSSFSLSSFDDLRMGNHGPTEYLRPEFVVTNGITDYQVRNQNPLVQKRTGYDQANYMQKILFKPNRKIDVNLDFFYTKTSDVPRYDRLLRYRGENLRSAEWFYGPQKWFMSHASIDVKESETAFFNSAKASIAYQNFDESRIDRDFRDFIRNTRKETLEAYSFNVDFNKIFNSKLNVFYGLEYVFNSIDSNAFQENIETLQTEAIVTRYPNGSTWQSAAAYVNFKYKPLNKLTIQSGLRYNTITSKANLTPNNQFLSLPFNSFNVKNNAFTGTFGVSWLPNDLLHWRFNLSSAFRAPNIDDLAKVFDSEPGSVVVPNAAIKPEKAYGGELGLTLNFENTFSLDLATYYTHLENALVRANGDLNGSSQIFYDGELSNVQTIQNASQTKIYGFELGAKVNFTPKLYSKTQYNIIGGDEINSGFETPVRHVSPSFGNSHIVWQPNKFKFDGFINFNGELSNNQLANSELEKDFIYALDENGKPFSPSWYTLNFATQYQLSYNTTITARLENITDQRYKTYSSGIAAPGRNVIVALKYNL